MGKCVLYDKTFRLDLFYADANLTITILKTRKRRFFII